MGYGGMGYGVWGTALRARPEGTIFLRGALRARVIVRNSFGACGGRIHLLGSTMTNILAFSHSRSSLGVHQHDLPILVFKPVLLLPPSRKDGGARRYV